LTHVKVSGITRPEDAAIAARLGADLVACVFHARSPRYVTAERAWAIRAALPRTVGLVGVFVDTPTPLVQLIRRQCQLDYVQLFGHESRAELAQLGDHAIKAVTVTEADDIPAVARTYLPRRPRRGDTDVPPLLLHLADAADGAWAAVRAHVGENLAILASSSLGPDTADAAIRECRPWGLDVWDAVETAPGHLDPERLAAFVAAVRSADRAMDS
jgi:phosphoribosylanthranilate isomerase